MSYSADQYLSVVNMYLEEWSKRNRSELVKQHNKGCFVWKADIDGIPERSGMFYTSDMLPKHFKGPMVDMVQRLIAQADSEREFVVVLEFPEDKVIRLLLHSVSSVPFT